MFSSFLWGQKKTSAGKKIIAKRDTSVDHLNISAFIHKNNKGKDYFSYRIKNLNSKPVYFDTTGLFVSYYVNPGPGQTRYVSYSMSYEPAGSQVQLVPLQPGKTFVKTLLMDSTGFKTFSFEFYYYNEEWLKTASAREGNNYKMHYTVYLQTSKKVRIYPPWVRTNNDR